MGVGGQLGWGRPWCGLGQELGQVGPGRDRERFVVGSRLSSGLHRSSLTGLSDAPDQAECGGVKTPLTPSTEGNSRSTEKVLVQRQRARGGDHSWQLVSAWLESLTSIPGRQTHS